MQKLTGKQVRYLRGLGHHLQPVVLIGREEVSDGLLASLEAALADHELVKVKLQEGCLTDRREVADQLVAKTGAQIAQILGRTILLYRASLEDPQIKLP